MKAYLQIVKGILDGAGSYKPAARANMPGTFGLSNAVIRHDLYEGFPLLTTKKMYWKGIVCELLWMLKGDTNIRYLLENNVHIWDQDAYRFYLKQAKAGLLGSEHGRYPLEFDRFVALCSELRYSQLSLTGNYRLGDLGKIYGYQWRSQNGVDQIAEVLDSLNNAPFSRYHIIDGWNKADFTEMALPPCHLLYQFIVRPDRKGLSLDLNMYQRSCDIFLGVPFNIASMALMLLIFSKACGYEPGVITWIGGDVHVYETHLVQAYEQLRREPRPLPSVKLVKNINTLEDIERLTPDDFILEGYDPYPAIKAKLSTGL